MEEIELKRNPKNMMYTQQLKYLPTGTKEKLVEIIEQKLKPKEYAVIVHDKDIDEDGTPVEAHIHAMLCFENARSMANIAKLLGDKPQYIERWNGSRRNGFAYLVHATKGALDKHQYSPEEVTANFDFVAELESITQAVKKSKKRNEETIPFLLDALYDGTVSKEEIESRLTGSQYARHHRAIDAVYTKRLKNLASEFRRKMKEEGRKVESIWIYGPSETGKSSFAKEIARKRKRPYFTAGSNRDRFQNYEGQPTIIIDEIRPTDFEFSQLLRLLDPYGEDAVAPSRYFDKELACDLIIITTVFNPLEFFQETFHNKHRSNAESVWQLIRRLSCIIEMDAYTIQAVKYLPRAERFMPIIETRRTNMYSGFSRPAQQSEMLELYNSCFDDCAMGQDSSDLETE